MKKQFFLSMLAAAAMMVSCSNENVTENSVPLEPGGDGYVAFNIQLPQTLGAATRSNDEFNDGDPLPTEYQVNNATLFLFTGSSENAAKFCGAYTLNVKTFTPDASATDQCSTEGIVSSKITNPTVTGNLYAYVIINHNGMVESPTATTVTIKTTNGSAATTESVTTSTTFETFGKYVLASIGDATNGYVMTNCPVNDATAGTAAPTSKNVSVLATLDASKIKPTVAEAEANPAGEIFVERAAVKVSVNTSLTGTPAITNNSAVKYDASSFKWALQNENQAYYNARQMTASWLDLVADGTEGTLPTSTKYRFASGAAIHVIGTKSVVRTYWGTDVNYSEDVTSTSTYKFKALPTTAYITNAANTSVYTFENTFDVKRQASKNTTQVALSVAFNGGVSFYTASTYGDNNILQVPSYSGTEKTIQQYIMEYLCANNAAFNTWYATSGNRITVEMEDRLATSNGYHKVKTVTRISGAASLPTGIQESDIKNIINGAIKFKYYANGLAYYRVRIKHFGAELASGSETPWSVTHHTANSIAGVYETYDGTTISADLSNANYLGRYGILRNNWYQLDVTGIKNIGYPLPGDPNTPGDPNNPDDPNPWTPDVPDDEVENYIAVKIHVTPWALRKQSVIL